jgi:hypothetical protein
MNIPVAGTLRVVSSLRLWVHRSFAMSGARRTPASYLRDWLTDIVAALVLLIATIISISGALGQPDRMLTGHDIAQLYNWEINTRWALSQGQLPLWNPFIFSGFPALADFQTGVLYPVSILLRWLPLESFIAASVTVHLWLAGTGTYILCRVLGTSRPAALMAGLGFGLGGALSPRILAGMPHFLFGIAWVPWAALAGIRSGRRGALTPYPGLVIVLTTQYLAGYVQVFVYTVGVALLCHFWSAAALSVDDRPLAARMGRAFTAAFIVLVFVAGVSAVQIVSAARLLPEMGRLGGITYEAAARWSAEPRDILALLFPRIHAASDPARPFHEASGAILWEKSAYVGLLLPLFAAAGVMYGRKRRDVWLVAGIGLLCLMLALANSLPLYRIHHALLGGFRYPGRLLPFVSLAISVLAAIGLDGLLSELRRGEWHKNLRIRLVLSAAALTVGGYASIAALSSPPGTILGTPWWVVISSIAVLGCLAFWPHRSAPSVIPIGLIVLAVSTDLVTFARTFVTTQPIPRFAPVAGALRADAVGRVVSACEEGFSLYRPFDETVPFVDGLNTAFARRYALYASLTRDDKPASSLRQFPTVWIDIPRRLDLLDLMNATHAVKCTPLDSEHFERVGREGGLYLYRNPSSSPRAEWVCDVDFAQTEAQALDLLGNSKRDARRRAVLERPLGLDVPNGLDGCERQAEVTTVLRDTPRGQLVANVHAPTDGLLLLSETYFPDRRAWIDGSLVRLYRANLAFSAVLVPAGDHLVELDFDPTPVYLGALISLVAVLTLAVTTAAARRRRPRGNFSTG